MDDGEIPHFSLVIRGSTMAKDRRPAREINYSSPCAIVISTATTFRGGEYQVRVLANALSERGYAMVMACNRKTTLKRIDFPHTRWVTYGHASGLGLRGCARLLGELRRYPSSVLVCNDSKALTMAALVSLLVPVPIVGVRRVYFPFARNRLSRWKYGRCSCIVAISTAVAERCRDTLPGVPVEVIPSTTAALTNGHSSGAVRERLGLNARDTVCLSVADFTNPGKRLDLLIQVAAGLREQHHGLRLLLVGRLPPGARSDLPQWCVPVGHSNAVSQYYAAADMYLCTSRHEGLGTAILDAVVRDIPAVAPAAGGAGDMFPDTAWLADEAVEGSTFHTRASEILDNIEEARARARRYGAWARNRFAPAHMVDSYAKLLDRLAGPRELEALAPQQAAPRGGMN